ncbi:MAG: hypothetical protein GY757_20405 [bacterium]|nr:hypothetical protein [bacterium]
MEGNETGFTVGLKALRKPLRNLARKKNIPAIIQCMPLIREMQADDFPCNVTVLKLEEIRETLRHWVRLTDRDTGRFLRTGLIDQIENIEGCSSPVDFCFDPEEYREKADRFFREFRNNNTICKLKSNQFIPPQEWRELERNLFEEGPLESLERLQETSGEVQPLGLVIRQVIGMEQEAVQEAFGDFLAHENLSSLQLRFIDAIIAHFRDNGFVKTDMLYEAPFIDLHDNGVSGLFDEKKRRDISGIIAAINGSAISA